MNSIEWWESRTKEFKTNKDFSPESEVLKEIIDRIKPKKILEVGCNFGRELKRFEGKYELFGVDFNENMIKNAKKHVKNANFAVSNAIDLPFDDWKFDCVYTCGLLSHLDDSEYNRAINEIFRVSSDFVLLNEYLGSKVSRNSIENVKKFTWIRDYSNIFNLNYSLILKKEKFYGTDCYQTVVYRKVSKLRREVPVIEKVTKEKEKRFVFKLGKLRVEIE